MSRFWAQCIAVGQKTCQIFQLFFCYGFWRIKSLNVNFFMWSMDRNLTDSLNWKFLQALLQFKRSLLDANPLISCKDAANLFLKEDLSLYQRKARLLELFTGRLSNELLVGLALTKFVKTIQTSSPFSEKSLQRTVGRKRPSKSVLNKLCWVDNFRLGPTPTPHPLASNRLESLDILVHSSMQVTLDLETQIIFLTNLQRSLICLTRAVTFRKLKYVINLNNYWLLLFFLYSFTWIYNDIHIALRIFNIGFCVFCIFQLLQVFACVVQWTNDAALQNN